MQIHNIVYSSKSFFYQCPFREIAGKISAKSADEDGFDFFVPAQLSLASRIMRIKKNEEIRKQIRRGDLLFGEIDPEQVSLFFDPKANAIVEEYPANICALLYCIFLVGSTPGSCPTTIFAEVPSLFSAFSIFFDAKGSLRGEVAALPERFLARRFYVRSLFHEAAYAISLLPPNRFLEEKRLFKEADKLLKAYVDAVRLSAMLGSGKVSLLATVGKHGIMNLCFRYEFGCEPFSPVALLNHNATIAEAKKAVGEAQSMADALPSLFSLSDLNGLFGLTRFTIVQPPSGGSSVWTDPHVDQSEFSLIFSRFSELKIPDQGSKARARAEQNTRLFYHLFSIRCCYGRDFSDDEMEAGASAITADWLQNKMQCSEIFRDLTPNGSDHFFQSGERFYYSTIETAEGGRLLFSCGATEATRGGHIVTRSHAFRYVADVDQRIVGSSIVYGSMALLACHLIEGAAVYKISKMNAKFRRLIFIHWYVRESGKVRQIYNSKAIYAKTSPREFCQCVMKSLGLEYMEEKSRITTEILWQEANMTTSQKYGKIGAVISLSSLFIALISAGFVVAVINAPLELGDSFRNAALDIANSPFFWAALCVLALPILAEAASLVIDYSVGRHCALIKWIKLPKREKVKK